MNGEVIVGPDPVKQARTWMLGKFPWPVTVTKNRPNPTTGRIVTIRANGGLRRMKVTDEAWLYVECFADTDEDAADLARHTWGLLLGMQGEQINGVQTYRVTPIAAPNDFPDEAAQKPRFVMSAQVAFRATAL